MGTDRARGTVPPASRQEMEKLGLAQVDFVYVTGDAYIDHPSFGSAIITRVLMDAGFTVGLICQPDWHDPEAFRALGRPKLAFLVSSGNIDSMVNHYTAARKRRSEDSYTEGGLAGKRPDRALIVYCNLCRRAYPGVPVLAGGIEASLRRFAHYDYWDDRVRHSVLYDAGADILMYGMGERSVVALARALAEGRPLKEIRDVPGTCYQAADISHLKDPVVLPSYQEVSADKKAYCRAFMLETREQDAVRGRVLVQAHEKGYLVANPPAGPLTQAEMDRVYGLPYTRRPHPMYTKPIPALQEVEFSLTSCRGCFGACSFCALTFHQGRVVQVRSHASLLREAKLLTELPGFKGYIHDVGGPTANFRQPACAKQLTCGVCPDRQCIGYKPCPNMKADESDYVALLQKLRDVPRVKKVFVRSGVRFDYMLYDKSPAFLKELVEHHISGQLKVAPEHVSDRVLYYMNKPPHRVYEEFVRRYETLNRKEGRAQYLVPYFISSHPGCTLDDAIELAEYIRRTGHRPEQVQDFYSTPGTLSTCMYYTGLDPRTMESVHIPRDEEKRMQRALMQYWIPANRPLVRKALRLRGREDLVGRGPGALVPPENARPEREAGRSDPRRKEAPAGKPPAKSGIYKNSAEKRKKLSGTRLTKRS